MINLMRWLRALPARRPARRSPGRGAHTPPPQDDSSRFWQSDNFLQPRSTLLMDKMMRPGRDYEAYEPDYDDKGACP